MIAVGGEESQLRTGRRLHPPDAAPVRLIVRLGLEWGVGGLGHIGGAVHPVRNRRPGILGYRLDEIVQAGALADGDREADIHPAADGDHGVGIEAAVGPHRELAPGFAVAHPPHRFTQEVGSAAGGVGPALAQAGQQHVAGAGGDRRVGAPLACNPTGPTHLRNVATSPREQDTRSTSHRIPRRRYLTGTTTKSGSGAGSRSTRCRVPIPRR